MNEDALIALILENKWWGVAALFIGGCVRLMKSDGPIPITVPARWRPWLALVLGAAAGVFEKLNAGVSWKQALVGGFLAAFIAISGHQLFIESARNGRELGR